MSVDKSLAGNILMTAASVVIVIAGIKSSASILIPFLLAIFIAILSAPLMHWLTRHRVPEVLALLLILVGFLLCLFFGGFLVGFLATVTLLLGGLGGAVFHLING